MFYRLISFLLLPFWWMHGWRHGVKRGHSDYLSRRLLKNLPAASQDMLWFHAASVGEVEAITPLVKHYLAIGRSLLFTSFTASGLATIRKNFGDSVTSTVIPIDLFSLCRKFFEHFPIRQGIIMETELWPELLRAADQRGIPLLLVNARLSAKSTDNRLLRPILRDTLNRLSFILCRNQSDRDRFTELGADQERIRIVGNLKAVSGEAIDYENALDRPYLLLASSHEGEEVDFLQSRPLDSSLPLLVIVPRHPERSKALQSMLESQQIDYAVRSQQQLPQSGTTVYLADTLGELQAWMQHAEIVIMGGSFDATGGHNLHEPARLGCAIITGPSDSNIRDDIDWLEPDKGIIQVTTMAQAWEKTMQLLKQPALAKSLGDHARQRSFSAEGMLQQYVTAIDEVISRSNNQA